MFIGTAISGNSGGSGGNINVRDAHVDVPKHNLSRLASTWTVQKQVLIMR